MTAKPLDKTSKKRCRSDDEQTPSSSRASKKEKKAAKKVLESTLLSKIPTLDPDGIPYSKIQIRRMKRRVKHGLDPIPTEEEEKEIKKRKEEEKREVEELLADNEKSDDDQSVPNEDEEDPDEEDVNEDDDTDAKNDTSTEPQSVYKKPRSKPVPPDYVCSACQNKPKDGEFNPHWIYDCPFKITKRGCNTKSKKNRGLTDPASRKVFVSGLPFDVTERGVKKYFDQVGEVVHVKLLKFEDSQRCKGQGILTFDTDAQAKDALNLSGEIWSEKEKDDKKKKTKVDKEGKELRLKVSKVLNRFVTKKQKKV